MEFQTSPILKCNNNGHVLKYRLVVSITMAEVVARNGAMIKIHTMGKTTPGGVHFGSWRLGTSEASMVDRSGRLLFNGLKTRDFRLSSQYKNTLTPNGKGWYWSKSLQRPNIKPIWTPIAATYLATAFQLTESLVSVDVAVAVRSVVVDCFDAAAGVETVGGRVHTLWFIRVKNVVLEGVACWKRFEMIVVPWNATAPWWQPHSAIAAPTLPTFQAIVVGYRYRYVCLVCWKDPIGAPCDDFS